MNITLLLPIGGAICACALALVVVLFEKRPIVKWSFVCGMILLASECWLNLLSVDALVAEATVRRQNLRMAVSSLVPGIWLVFSFSYARGNYKDFLRKWRGLITASFVVPIGLLIASRGDFITPIQLHDQDEQHWVMALNSLGAAGSLINLLAAVLILLNLEATFRTSVGTMRWRIKFMLLGLGVLFAMRAYVSSQSMLFRTVQLPLQILNSGALLVACLLILRSLVRAGHFDVNVYPSQLVLHKSIIMLLAGVYLLLVGLLANWTQRDGGDSAFTLKAFLVLLSLVLLTVLLLSERLRLHTRRFVSRHFQRPLYDYRSVWRRFTEGTATRVEQAELCNAAVKLLTDIFQVLSVTVWLVDEKKENLVYASSTSLSEEKAADLRPESADVIEMLKAFRAHPEAVDIDSAKEHWAAALRRCQPDEFRKGGRRICVPMMVGGDVIGLITIGDRVGGIPFSMQDFDLLRCVGDQVAANILNAQLSKKLMQAKEVEAFQTMSTFFVHDLKNTASTLSLMLKNLPIHFDDPAFREDALRGISKTVTHINHLISRLSTLREGLKMQRAEKDLNELVTRCLSDWPPVSGIELSTDLQPLPAVMMDVEQMSKVITNLLLNAREAMSGQGKIHVGTAQVNTWAVLTVSDNGCGMSPEFLNRQLFRAFQTTKKSGIGIGMFQSKMIVEAHGGRIEVESHSGKGTTFRIFLPLQLQSK